jgi:hypothetical protein
MIVKKSDLQVLAVGVLVRLAVEVGPRGRLLQVVEVLQRQLRVRQ